MAKQRRKRKPATDYAEPTPEQLASGKKFLRPTPHRIAHNDVEPAGAAMRVVPVIYTLVSTGQLTFAQYLALAYYRQQANQAEDDIAQAGTLAPEKIMGGGCGGARIGGYIPASLLSTPAIIETGRIERCIPTNLLDITQRVARDDWTLTRWCIEQHGGRERYSKGKFVAMIPNGRKSVENARMDLQFAAGYITKGLDGAR